MLNKQLAKFFCLLVSFASMPTHAWNPFGPNNFDDCIIANMKGVTSDSAAASIRLACRQKFPDKRKEESSKQTTRFGNPRLNVWDRPYNSRAFENIKTGRTKINSYGGMEIPITNKNEFNLSGIYIGVTTDKKPGKCSIEKSDYLEIYECNGEVYSNTTKTLYCSPPQGPWSIVGFKADFQVDVDKFFKDIGN